MSNRITKPALIAAVVLSLTVAFAPLAHAQSWRGDEDKPAPAAIQVQLSMFSQLLNLVNQVADLAKDPTASGVAAVFTAKDTIGEPKATAEFLETMLKKAENPSVIRALHMQLADIYKNMGQKDKALDHLAVLITADE